MLDYTLVEISPSQTPQINNKTLSKSTQKFAERFLPNRASSNLLSSFDKIHEDLNFADISEENQAVYSSLLQNQLFQNPKKNLFKYSRQIKGKENEPLAEFGYENLYSPLQYQRKLPKSPFKVLDAPALQDDFYLNLLDWSSTNILTVGLGVSVYS